MASGLRNRRRPRPCRAVHCLGAARHREDDHGSGGRAAAGARPWCESGVQGARAGADQPGRRPSLCCHVSCAERPEPADAVDGFHARQARRRQRGIATLLPYAGRQDFRSAAPATGALSLFTKHCSPSIAHQSNTYQAYTHPSYSPSIAPTHQDPPSIALTHQHSPIIILTHQALYSPIIILPCGRCSPHGL